MLSLSRKVSARLKFYDRFAECLRAHPGRKPSEGHDRLHSTGAAISTRPLAQRISRRTLWSLAFPGESPS